MNREDGPFNWLRRSGNGFFNFSAKLGITAVSSLELAVGVRRMRRARERTIGTRARTQVRFRRFLVPRGVEE